MHNFLAISGSLREGSSNASVLQAAAALAPPEVRIALYDGLAALPHFNPDLDGDTPPPAVADFRRQLREADAVLICSPEYAHGVPGSLKNALDWIVGSGEFMEKPVALINASPRATLAYASLRETLTVMMARIVPDASVTVPLKNNRVTVAEIIADTDTSAVLRAAVASLELVVAP